MGLLWTRAGSLSSELGGSSRGLDVNVQPPAAEDEAARSSSPNSAASSFQMDLCIYNSRGGSSNKRDFEGEAYDQRTSSRASDDDDNNGSGGNTRKKLRLSKEQSAFLEESFKEHNTLNPVSAPSEILLDDLTLSPIHSCSDQFSCHTINLFFYLIYHMKIGRSMDT